MTSATLFLYLSLVGRTRHDDAQGGIGRIAIDANGLMEIARLFRRINNADSGLSACRKGTLVIFHTRTAARSVYTVNRQGRRARIAECHLAHLLLAIRESAEIHLTRAERSGGLQRLALIRIGLARENAQVKALHIGIVNRIADGGHTIVGIEQKGLEGHVGRKAVQAVQFVILVEAHRIGERRDG